ncbi:MULTISPECIES: hypothetical protein [Pseudomonas]|jgi:hypothetical protein|uniref:hypothetical protein n=1 Tax=Pseudomonas TaxID=286 RepID=UPI001476386F|nr:MULTISPECIES: hypothetical protein [Pseudomonas]NMX36572.1 hypothetical protein [Pseudomonas veronii]UHH00622.1 hypothetical protein LQ249_14475 [Pseudomonas sp. 7-41]
MESVGRSSNTFRKTLINPPCSSSVRRRAAGLAFAGLLLVGSHAAAQDEPAFSPNLPSPLSPVLPSDVNPAMIGALTKKGEFAQVQRVFDIYSWQQFLALNWPTGEQGKPAERITDVAFGPPAWTRWHESFEIFGEHGQPPTLAQTLAARPQRMAVTSRHGVALGPLTTTDRAKRVLSIVSATKALTVLNETEQAFTHPLWDQHGSLAYYEILINDVETQYIVKNELYNLDGQIAFASTHNALNMPAGLFDHPEQPGAVELKLAWRVLDEAAGDIPQRFFTADAAVLNSDGKGWHDVKVGLVGMHIAHKTGTSPQWTWSTFEHVDNLQVNSLETVQVNGEQRHLRASFNNPDCETCLVNTYPPTKDTATGQLRTQVTRVIPIPPATQQLNRQAQALLHDMGSVWQYYELINTQWPTDPGAPPTTPGPDTLPASIDNKSGGKPTPVYLANSIMETYFQLGNQPVGTQEEGSPAVSDKVFGTESCMGCHYSAGIASAYTISPSGIKTANFSGPNTSDFSWMFQQLAHFRSVSKPATDAKPTP